MKKIYNKGFTLVELLVVVTIMVILGLIFTDTLIQSLRGQNKVKAINIIKQNSQVVLEKMANEIRQAEAIVCVSPDTIVIARGSNYLRYRFYEPKSTTPRANGYIATDYTFSPGESACTSEAQVASQMSVLTDQDLTKGVSLMRDGSAPIFNWTRKESETGFNDVVVITFRATAGLEAGQTYENTVSDGGILFNTTIQVRGGQ